MSEIGESITLARDLRQLSQAELAKKSGISQVQISRIEGGEIKNPSFKDISCIAEALNLPLTALNSNTGSLVSQITEDNDHTVIGYAKESGAPVYLVEDPNKCLFMYGGKITIASVLDSLIESINPVKLVASSLDKSSLKENSVSDNTPAGRKTSSVFEAGLENPDSLAELIAAVCWPNNTDQSKTKEILAVLKAEDPSYKKIAELDSDISRSDLETLLDSRFQASTENSSFWNCLGKNEFLASCQRMACLNYLIEKSEEETIFFELTEDIFSNDSLKNLFLSYIDKANLKKHVLHLFQISNPERISDSEIIRRYHSKLLLSSLSEDIGLSDGDSELLDGLPASQGLFLSGQNGLVDKFWIDFG